MTSNNGIHLDKGVGVYVLLENAIESLSNHHQFAETIYFVAKTIESV